MLFPSKSLSQKGHMTLGSFLKGTIIFATKHVSISNNQQEHENGLKSQCRWHK